MRRVSWSFVLACVIIVLVLVNIVLVEANRSSQSEVAQRAQFIQQSAQLENLNREVVTALANLAVQNNDDQLRTLLAQQGITINPAQAAGQGKASGAPPATSGKR